MYSDTRVFVWLLQINWKFVYQLFSFTLYIWQEINWQFLRKKNIFIIYHNYEDICVYKIYFRNDYYRWYYRSRVKHKCNVARKLSARKLSFFIPVARKASLMRTRIYASANSVLVVSEERYTQDCLHSVFIIRAASLVGLQNVLRREQEAAETFYSHFHRIILCESSTTILHIIKMLIKSSLYTIRIQTRTQWWRVHKRFSFRFRTSIEFRVQASSLTIRIYLKTKISSLVYTFRT